MSLYEEIWNPSEYEPRNEVFLRDLPKNHIAKLKAVNFEFTDYKAANNLGCYPYQRMVVHCLNHYGISFMNKDIQCRDIFKFFGDCVRTNQAFGFLKRTRPEYFATNEYSREKPTFAELSV